MANWSGNGRINKIQLGTTTLAYQADNAATAGNDILIGSAADDVLDGKGGIDLIRAGGHDVQLHLHPEWSDELTPLPFPGASRKRQHLAFYTLEEQTILIRMGLDLLAQVGCAPITAFRAGSFAANA